MKILLTAKQRGSVNALLPVSQELQQRGHQLTIYATGNETESAGFGERINLENDDYAKLVSNQDVVVTGLSGYNTPDGLFWRAANSAGLPTVAVLDQDLGYEPRLGQEIENLPQLIAIMDASCRETMKKELPLRLGEEAVKRSRVVGWTAFDHYQALKDKFSEVEREKLLNSLSINHQLYLHLHFTQNIHPDTNYLAKINRAREESQKIFDYEMFVTKAIFEAASDIGLKLAVKPHPGEEFKENFTLDLAQRHGFIYIPAKACSSQQLMLTANSITAGRSTCLTEATLLDRNTGGIFPELKKEELKPFPPATLEAIPYTLQKEFIENVLSIVSSNNEATRRMLTEKRKKFSVDGKASKRLADLIEGLI